MNQNILNNALDYIVGMKFPWIKQRILSCLDVSAFKCPTSIATHCECLSLSRISQY